jgi:hypothetical protein
LPNRLVSMMNESVVARVAAGGGMSTGGINEKTMGG